VGLLYQHANVAGLDHVGSLFYTTSPNQPENVSIYGFGYHIPLYSLGDSIDLYGARSNVDAGTVSAGTFNLQVSGKGSAYGVRYNQDVGTLRGIESKLIYGLDYRSYDDDVSLGGIPLGNEVIVHPVAVTYAGRWAGSSARIGGYVGAFVNVPGGDQGNEEDFERVRTGASARYSILRYGADYTQSLPRNWALRLNLAGQYTRDQLIPGEQFAVGGATTVRGFQEREIANDVGYFYNVELYTPDLCSAIRSIAAQCQALAFADGARLSRNEALPGEDTGGSIGSVGVGMRMSIEPHLTVRLDVAQVINAGGSEAKGDWRLHFAVAAFY
jgi:hemolysin activation/secretion protein